MMLKSGLIFGAIALLLSAGAALLSPLCVPCLALFLGLGAGYVAGVFDKPADNGASTKSGALSGVISGLGALLGQLIGAAINGSMVGPERAASILQQFGLPTGNGAGFGPGYWAGLFASGCCLGILDIALMAGLGALGGVLWWQMSGKKAVPAPLQ
jgi:hypothetical protein